MLKKVLKFEDTWKKQKVKKIRLTKNVTNCLIYKMAKRLQIIKVRNNMKL